MLVSEMAGSIKDDEETNERLVTRLNLMALITFILCTAFFEGKK